MARNLTQLDAYIPPELIALTHRTVTAEEFEELSAKYRDLRLELTSTGELIVMPPTGLQIGRKNFNLIGQLAAWFRQQRDAGVCFDSDTGFTLPNGAIRSPDAAWVKREKWDRLPEEQKARFGQLSPDFVVEIRTASDRLTEVHNKMIEWLENGASLGWLIDPSKRRVYVYRPGEEVITLDNPDTISADPLLPGFTLNLTELWSE